MEHDVKQVTVSKIRSASHEQILFNFQDNLVLSTELIMWIGHRKEI